MAYKRLWILIEGSDDEIFFEEIMRPVLQTKYKFVGIWQYAQEPLKRTKDFLRSIKSMGSDYLFLRDINNLPCATAKKDSIRSKYGRAIDPGKVIVVIPEVESWYLAGLDDKTCNELGLQTFANTDNITKEIFNNLKPDRFSSRIDFMRELLKKFSMETAIRKNKSFGYFIKRIGRA